MSEDNQEDENIPELVPLKDPSLEKSAGILEDGHQNVKLDKPYLQVDLEPQSQSKQTLKTGWRRYRGLIFALLSSLFFSFTVLLVKLLHQNHGHHPFVLTMWRYGGIFVPSIPIAIYFQMWTKVQVFETVYPLNDREKWKNLVIYLMQGILGCTAVIFRFVSIQYITIGDSTVVVSATSVLVTILAHFFLGEKCSVVSIFLAFTTAIGVMIIARPPVISGDSEFNLTFLTGTMYAVLALICASNFIIVMRKIRKTHFSMMMLVGGTWGVFESALLAVILGVFSLPKSLTEIALILSLAGFTFLGQIFFVLAVKYENAGPLSIARTTESIYTFLWQFLFLGIVPDYISVIGGSLVLTAVICTGYYKYLSSLKTDHPMRIKLHYLIK